MDTMLEKALIITNKVDDCWRGGGGGVTEMSIFWKSKWLICDCSQYLSSFATLIHKTAESSFPVNSFPSNWFQIIYCINKITNLRTAKQARIVSDPLGHLAISSPCNVDLDSMFRFDPSPPNRPCWASWNWKHYPCAHHRSPNPNTAREVPHPPVACRVTRRANVIENFHTTH